MNRIIKLLGLATAFLFIFLLVMLASNPWLHRRADQLRVEALAQKEAQFIEILALAHLPRPPWTDRQIAALERAIGGSVTVEPASDPAAVQSDGSSNGGWQFTVPVSFEHDVEAIPVRVSLPTPPTVRLRHTYQYVATALLALAFSFLFVLASAAIWISRRDRNADTSANQSTGRASRGEISSFAQLAKTSVHQSEVIEAARIQRLRLEEDLNVHHLLLNRALEQKVRLGQDLHDGIIQSLYANGLTLEVAKGLTHSKPAEVRALLEQSQQALNATIREVRTFISGLSPSDLNSGSLGDSVRALVAGFAAGSQTRFSVVVEDVATERLPDSEQADLLQIIRESISNSTRHGSARNISVTLAERDEALRLEIRDDGQGFNPQNLATRGHGLTNIEARSRRLGAACSITSAPGKGTVVTLAFTGSVIMALSP